MLSKINIEKLPSFEIGYERAMQKAVKALYKMGADIKTISKELGLSVEEIKKFLKNEK